MNISIILLEWVAVLKMIVVHCSIFSQMVTVSNVLKDSIKLQKVMKKKVNYV